MGVNIPKNFDAEGALGYTALAIVNSGFTVSKEVIVDTLIKVASKGLDLEKTNSMLFLIKRASDAYGIVLRLRKACLRHSRN